MSGSTWVWIVVAVVVVGAVIYFMTRNSSSGRDVSGSGSRSRRPASIRQRRTGEQQDGSDGSRPSDGGRKRGSSSTSANTASDHLDRHHGGGQHPHRPEAPQSGDADKA
jgi:hypothetical protein